MKRLVLILTAAVIFSSCSGGRSITIAEQYGLAYAPLQIMKAEGYLAELEPDLRVEWVRLGNTAAIREAMLSGQVDAGCMGIPPYLIGSDRGMDWSVVSGLSVCPLGLVASAGGSVPGEGLSSIRPDTRIALPQPGSIQHILLAMAAERQFGDPRYFDGGLVTMKHPDGMAALLSGAVDAHFTSPPYLFLENGDERFTTVLDGFEAFGGEFSFIVAVVSDSFRSSSPEAAAGFEKALELAIDFMNENPQKAVEILSPVYGLDERTLASYLSSPGMKFTGDVLGLDDFRSFMIRTGYIGASDD